MKNQTIFSILALLLSFAVAAPAFASAQKTIYTAPLVYRGDGLGGHTFKDSMTADGTAIAKDGSVNYKKSPGTCDLKQPFAADDTITQITANWKFTGVVTLEVSATGRAVDYVKITNGVPLKRGKFQPGTQLLWRATLEPGSVLSEVKISWMDNSGVVGDFGEPELSRARFRKLVYVDGLGTWDEGRGTKDVGTSDVQASETNEGSASYKAFYNHPVRITVSSSDKDADVFLANAPKPDFSDIRFTQPDKETLLPYWLQEVKDAGAGKVAVFWVKVPQLPGQGHRLYMYYGGSVKASEGQSVKESAGDEVFDFFEDFSSKELNPGKWDTSVPSRITAKSLTFTTGILEFKALAGGKTYYYSITRNGKTDIFKKYDEAVNEVKIDDMAPLDHEALDKGILTLSTENVQYSWLRVRQYVDPVPAVDIAKTKITAEEVPNLPEFNDVSVASDGALVLAGGAQKGEYVSALIQSPFKARVMVPSWAERQSVKASERQSVKVDFSTKENGDWKKDCENKKYCYASKKSFVEGDDLRFRVVISSEARNPIKTRSLSPAGFEMTVPSSASLVKFTLDARSGKLAVLKPSAGESVQAGSVFSIVWDATEYDSTYNFNLNYSKDGGATFEPITTVGNTGRYGWAVDSGQWTVDSGKGVIKISDALDETVYAVSNGFNVVTSEQSQVTSEEETMAAQATQIATQTPQTDTPEPMIEPVDIEKLAKKAPRLGAVPYDVVIKINNDPAGKSGAEGDVYKSGDVIMARPVGNVWSETEKNSFLILELNLTPEEADSLTTSVEKNSGKKDLAGNPIKTTIKKRAQRINIEKMGFSKDSLNDLKDKKEKEAALKKVQVDAAGVIEEKK